jgi:hypothetical protein
MHTLAMSVHIEAMSVYSLSMSVHIGQVITHVVVNALYSQLFAFPCYS